MQAIKQTTFRKSTPMMRRSLWHYAKQLILAPSQTHPSHPLYLPWLFSVCDFNAILEIRKKFEIAQTASFLLFALEWPISRLKNLDLKFQFRV